MFFAIELIWCDENLGYLLQLGADITYLELTIASLDSYKCHDYDLLLTSSYDLVVKLAPAVPLVEYMLRNTVHVCGMAILKKALRGGHWLNV